jgi:hypothetical protein
MISWHSSQKAFAHINYKTCTRNELNVMGTKIDLDSYKLHHSLNHHGKHYIPFSKKIYIKMIESSRLTKFSLKLGKVLCPLTLWNLIILLKTNQMTRSFFFKLLLKTFCSHCNILNWISFAFLKYIMNAEDRLRCISTHLFWIFKWF